MGYNLVIISVRTGFEGDNALPGRFFSTLRNTIPPHTTYLIFTELVVPNQDIDITVQEQPTIAAGIIVTTEGGVVVEDEPLSVLALEGVLVIQGGNN